MTTTRFAPTMVGKRLLTSAYLTLKSDCHPFPPHARGAKIRVKQNTIAGGLLRGAPAVVVARVEDGWEVSVRRRKLMTPTGRGDYHAIAMNSVVIIVADEVFWDVFESESINSISSWLGRET